jgi:hypothetical protein
VLAFGVQGAWLTIQRSRVDALIDRFNAGIRKDVASVSAAQSTTTR